MSVVVWHDIECGGYRQDLGVWLRLAREHGGPVLDVGAGTGRVTLELARAGVPVIALDADAALLDELSRRAAGLPGEVRTVHADARSFTLGERVPLIVVPMQTIQLLGGADGRRAFLERAAAALAPGGAVAIAIAERFEEFIVGDGEAGPMPDMREVDGVVYCSRPIAVRRDGPQYVLERVRETVDPAGRRDVAEDRIALDLLSAGTLEREAVAAGLPARGTATIAPTDEHIGSTVVIVGG